MRVGCECGGFVAVQAGRKTYLYTYYTILSGTKSAYNVPILIFLEHTLWFIYVRFQFLSGKLCSTFDRFKYGCDVHIGHANHAVFLPRYLSECMCCCVVCDVRSNCKVFHTTLVVSLNNSINTFYTNRHVTIGVTFYY